MIIGKTEWLYRHPDSGNTSESEPPMGLVDGGGLYVRNLPNGEWRTPTADDWRVKALANAVASVKTEASRRMMQAQEDRTYPVQVGIEAAINSRVDVSARMAPPADAAEAYCQRLREVADANIVALGLLPTADAVTAYTVPASGQLAWPPEWAE